MSGHFVSDVMVLNVDVLGPGLEDWIVCQSNRALIITFQQNDDGLAGSSRLILPSTPDVQFLVNLAYACDLLRDLNEGVLLVGL